MGRGRRSLRRRSSLRRCRPIDRSHCRWSRATASRRTLSSSATAHCTAAVFPIEYVRADGWLIASPQEGAAPPVRARNRLRASAWWCCRSQKTQSPGFRTGRGVMFTAKGERAADGDGGWRRQECACGRPLPARLRFLMRDGTYHCQNERHGVPTTIARVGIDQVLHYNNRRWRTSENQAASHKPQCHGLAGPTDEPVFSTVQSSPSASTLESITRCSIVYHTLQRLASQHGVPRGWATRC